MKSKTYARLLFPILLVTAAIAACGKEYATGEDRDAGVADTGADVRESAPSTSDAASDATSPTDGASPDVEVEDADAGADVSVPSACDLDAAFQTPSLVPGLEDTERGALTLSSDELIGVFDELEEGPNPSYDRDLFIATRPSREVAFGTPEPLSNINKRTLDQFEAALSGDGLRLIFTVLNRDDAGVDTDAVFWLASRASRTVPFGAAEPIPGLTTLYPASPFIVNDELYFANFVTAAERFDLFRAPLAANGTLGIKTSLAVLNSANFERGVAVTADGRTIYFGSNRTADDPLDFGQYEIYRSTRDRVTDAWSAPVLVTELGSDGYDSPSWVSPDGCRLYFSSRRGSTAALRLYVASKPAP